MVRLLRAGGGIHSFFLMDQKKWPDSSALLRTVVSARGRWWIFSTAPQRRLEQQTKDPQGRVRMTQRSRKSEKRRKDRWKAREGNLIKIFKQLKKKKRQLKDGDKLFSKGL